MSAADKLSERPLDTFLRIRWTGTLILGGVSLLSATASRTEWDTLWPALILLGIVIGQSLALRWAVRKPLRRYPAILSLLRWLIPVLDMVALTALSHLSGGIVSFFALTPLVYIVAAAPILGGDMAYFSAIWATILYGGMSLLEASGLMPPGQPILLAESSWEMVYADQRVVTALLLSLSGFFFLGAYIGSTIAGWLTRQRAEITRLYQTAQQETEKLRQAQEQLLRSGRLAAVGELASGLAHELNNPLGIILGNVQLALESSDLNPEQEQILKAIEAGGERIARLMRVLGEMVSLRDKQFEAVRIEQLLEDVLLLSGRRWEKAGIEVQKAFAPIPPVWGSPTQLFQVLQNLLTNAAEAMEGQEGPRTISIQVCERETQVVIRIDDTGPGIPSDHINHVLEPGFTTKVEEGRSRALGLGLFVAYYTIRAHGGTLDIESVVGEGTTVTIRLPALLT